MVNSQPPQTNSLKRKASSEFPPNANFDASAAEPLTQNGTHIASIYQQTYLETTTEIKKLLKQYSMAVDANNNAQRVNDYHNNTKDELKAILSDIANRPEYAEMDDVKNVLHDCGIDIQVHQNEAGVKSVDVQLKME